jgi:tetratricopeptide (TPR) repeat protein
MTVTLDSLKKAFGKKKVNTQAFAWLADYEREAGDLDTALQRVDGGLTMYPGDVAARLVRTKILFEKGDFEACVEECERVLKADPFCLSAQKRMGDAYERLEKINERNQCYRKVHDMDPLDKFWKDEYENVVAAAAVAAGADIGEMDLSMPGLDSQESGAPGEFSLGAAEGEMSFLEKSPDDGASAEDKGPKFGSGFEFVNQEPAEGTASASAETGMAEPAALGSQEGSEDDPFAALSALIPDSDAGEEAAMDSLQASLDSAMESINAEEPSAPEVFPSDDDISGNDVNSAMSNFFGVDDDLEAEEPAAPASPFSNFNLSASIDDEPAAAAAATNASMVFGTPAEEDKPQSVDSAFNDIFGEDELPEEPSATAAPVEDKPQSVDSAFNDIFGEDELPEEPGMFQKSAEVAAEAEPAAEELTAEEPALEPAPAPVEDKPQSVDSAFNDIFGEDELPEEGLFQKSAEVAPETEEAVAEEPAAEELVSEEPVAEDDLAQEPAVEDKPAESSDSVGSAFDSIFGGDDDLPEEGLFQKSAEVESPVEEPAVEDLTADVSAELEMPAEETSELAPAEESLEAWTPDSKPVEESLELETPAEESLEVWSPDVKPAEEPATTVQSGDAKEIEDGVGNALDSIFGDDDDLPEETPVATAPAAQDTPVEEVAAEPTAEAKDDLAEEMGGAFDSLFGNEDESTGAAVEEKNIPEASLEGDLDGLESEVSGAFKGLFESDDDDLPEEKPSNKGVDFLMSGDSDDEVSAGLIKDPSASLDNVNAALDANQNTRTMAEIYLEQGVYDKALEIYQGLAQKDPDNKEIQERLDQVRALYNEKFGG